MEWLAWRAARWAWFRAARGSVLSLGQRLGRGDWTVAAIASVSLAGFLLGYAMLASRNILVPIGLHAGWNFTQSLLTSDRYWEITRHDDPWRSGGAWGLEGSAIGITITAFGAVGALAWLVLRQRWGRSSRREDRPTLLRLFDLVHEELERRRIAHALIGGLALSTVGIPRATGDVDFLVDGEREDDVHGAMMSLGFSTLKRTQEVSNYALGQSRVDFIHARRPYALAMLHEARTVEIEPRRFQAANRNLDMGRVRCYYSLFGRVHELEEILAHLDDP